MGMQENYDAIRNALSTLEEVNYYTAAKLLTTMLANGELTLDTSVYTPVGQEIGRYEVYDNPDPHNSFSGWMFVIPEGKGTVIHDHAVEGTVIVLKGPVSEINYIPTVELASGEKFAKVESCADRDIHHINNDDLAKDDNDNPNVHQLKCRKGLGVHYSMTFHLYNMPAHRVDMDGNMTVNRNLKNVYSKDRSGEKVKRTYVKLFNPEKKRAEMSPPSDEAGCSFNI